MTLPSVLIVHNRYQDRGGEDSVVEIESALLREHGHRVAQLFFDNREIPARPGPRAALGLAAGTVWSRPARARVATAVTDFRPDVVHFHNTFPLISPAAYAAAKRSGAAVVQTLHNFRLVCPAGLLYRDSAVCEECVGRALPVGAVSHACYRNSRLQSGVAAAMLATHRLLGTWQRDVDLYISPSPFLARKMVAGGLPAARIAVKPNCLTPDPGPREPGGDFALFAGRLTETKGVRSLLAAYAGRRDGLPVLQLCPPSGGELAAEAGAAAACDARISYRSDLDRQNVIDLMGRALCLVFPSIWYENFPVVILEAYARGLPIVASRIGAVADLIEDGRTGLLYRPGDATDLADKLAWLKAHPAEAEAMGCTARETYLARYTGERNYEQLLSAYGRAMGCSQHEMNARA